MEILTPPQVDQQPAIPTIGITVTTPFRGMLATRDKLLAELFEWLRQAGVREHGDFFLRLHTIDMNGPMKLEVGIRDVIHPGDERVQPSRQL